MVAIIDIINKIVKTLLIKSKYSSIKYEVKYVPRFFNSERSEHQWCPQGASLSGWASIKENRRWF